MGKNSQLAECFSCAALSEVGGLSVKREIEGETPVIDRGNSWMVPAYRR
jgi:hypothetical protein